jgi:hypothetical protein
VYCWGKNVNGQLGNGTTTNSTVPLPVSVLPFSPTALMLGGKHSCARGVDGEIACWGKGAFGQLGTGSTQDQPLPVAIVLDGPAGSIATGASHSCAALTSGEVSCWGANQYGQVGDGTNEGRLAPTLTRAKVTPTPGFTATPDGDADGCTDSQESGPDQQLGGARDPSSFWDFFDTPNLNGLRDRAVTGTDLYRVLSRFSAIGDPMLDPLSAPPPAPAYHAAFDRGPSSGPNPWNLSQADGSITGTDFFAILVQFGHTCA